MTKNTIGKNIKELIRQKNITQSELADKVGISRGAMSAIVNGKFNPRKENLIKISNLLGVRMVDLTRNRELNTIVNPNIEIIELLNELTENEKIYWILQSEKGNEPTKKYYRACFEDIECRLYFSISNQLAKDITLIINKNKEEIVFVDDDN
ncbi:MAG: helix-turn-helix transcriptional regulator, partial [Anaerococcus sp.]|nr:helix-turn-helix transcriptional regulator [Anaerococcus sp.]